MQAAPPPERKRPRWLNAQSAVRVGQLELAVLRQDAEEIEQLADRLDADTATWPAPLSQSNAAAINHALGDYYRGIAALFCGKVERSIALEHAATRRFARIDQEQPNDPNLLFQFLWANYLGFGAASGVPGHEEEADEFLRATRRTIDRLIALEPNDQSLHMFKVNVEAAEAQALAAKGQYREAVSMQRSVIAFLTQSLGKERNPAILNRLVTARLVLGNIASQANNPELACASYRDSRALLSQLKAKNQAVGINIEKGKILDRNIARCARGEAPSEFEMV